MGLHVGTVAGLFSIDGSTEQVIGDTRINHVVDAGGTLWALDGKGRIHRDDSVVASLPDGETGLCVQPAASGTWIGAPAAKLYRLDDTGVSEDEFFADAPGREAWHTPWGGPPDVRSMTLDASQTLYINVHVGGILRYPTSEGAIFAACAYGLATSSNGHDFEIRDDGLHASYCRAVAVADETVYLSASTGPRTSRGRVYRGGLWEAPFEPMTAGLPEWFDGNVNTHCLLAKDDKVWIGFDDKVWVSDDRGESWSAHAGGLPKITCLT